MATGRKFTRSKCRSTAMASSDPGWDARDEDSSATITGTNYRPYNEPMAVQATSDICEQDSEETTRITCKQHSGEAIEMYCGNHDTVCCTVCIEASHRTCTKVDSISNIATEKFIHTEKERTLICLKQNLKILKELKTTQQILTGNKGVPTNNELADANPPKRRRSARLQAAGKKSTEKAEAKLNETQDAESADINAFDEMIEETESKLKLFAQADNNVKTFVNIKKAQQLILDGKTLIGQLSNTSIENKSMEKTKLYNNPVHVSKGAEYSGSPKNCSSPIGEYSIKLDSDTIQCFVCEICVLDNDVVVVADSSNYKLKQLDRDFNVSSSCRLPGQPGVMCRTGPMEVACIIHVLGERSGFIQFASVGQTLCLTRSFSVGEDCVYRKGICCFKGELYVLGKEHMIKVYTMSGEVLRTFYRGDLKLGTMIAKIQTDNCDLIISDGYRRIYILDEYGKKKVTITDKRFKTIFSVCAGETGQLFACSYYSHTIFLMDKRGKNKTEILKESDGIYHPMAVAYLQNSNYLVVGCYGTDNIKVFKISNACNWNKQI